MRGIFMEWLFFLVLAVIVLLFIVGIKCELKEKQKKSVNQSYTELSRAEVEYGTTSDFLARGKNNVKNFIISVLAFLSSTIGGFIGGIFLLAPITSFELGWFWAFTISLIGLTVLSLLPIPFLYEAITLILMPIGLINVINGVQDWFVTVYYIIFIIWCIWLLSRISFFIYIYKKQKEN